MKRRLDIEFDRVIPRYYQIENHVKSLVTSGKIKPGEKLPSEECLAESWDLNRLTVNKAICNLVNEGFLYRKKGRGTFAKKPTPKFLAEEIVGVVMHTKGHIYELLTPEILRNLQEHNFHCFLLDCQPMEKNISELDKLYSLMERNPAFLLVHGYSMFPFGVLRMYSGRIIFVHMFESCEQYDADFVLSDYYKGGRLAAEHFVSHGFDRLLFYMSGMHGNPRSRNALIRGGKDFFKEAGLPEKNVVIITGENKGEIYKELHSMSKPIGIFCDADNIALPIYRIAKQLGLTIPEDLSVVGYYNTPWCEIYEPRLTSISIREKDMAKLVVERVINGSLDKKTILVEPKIVERESCKIKT